jgi:hypothetical protein
MKSLPHLQTMPNRQQLLLRDAKNCRLELAERGIETSRYDWEKLARPNQLPPPGDWRGWLLLAEAEHVIRRAGGVGVMLGDAQVRVWCACLM